MASLDFDSLPDVKTEEQPKGELNFDALPDIDFDSLPDKQNEAVPVSAREPRDPIKRVPISAREPADPDMSSAMGDLTAGAKTLQQVIPGLSVAGAAGDLARSKRLKAGAGIDDKELSQIDARLAVIEKLPDTEWQKASDERAKLTARRAQIMMMYPQGAGPDAAREEAAVIEPGAVKALVENLQEIDRLNKEISAIPTNPSAAKFTAPEGESYSEQLGSMWDSLANDPSGVTRTLVLRSLPSSAPTIIAGVVGGFAGPGGAASLSALAGGSVEMGTSMAQYLSEDLQKRGIDPTDKAAVEKYALENTEEILTMIGKARARALVIGGASAAGGALTENIARSVATGPFARKAAGTVAGSGVEAVADAVGEAGAGLVTEGKVSLPDVAAEVIGGAGAGAPMTAGQIAREGLFGPRTGKPKPKIESVPEKGASDEQKIALNADDTKTQTTEPNREPPAPTTATAEVTPKVTPEAAKEPAHPGVHVGETAPDIAAATAAASDNTTPSGPPRPVRGTGPGAAGEFLKQMAAFRAQERAQREAEQQAQAQPTPSTEAPPAPSGTAQVPEGPQVGGAPAAPPNPAPATPPNALDEAQKMIADQGVKLTPETQQALADDYAQIDQQAPDFQEQMQALVDKYVQAGQEQPAAATDALPPAAETTPAQTTAPSEAGGSAPEVTPPVTQEVTPPAAPERKWQTVTQRDLLLDAGIPEQTLAGMKDKARSRMASDIRAKAERDSGMKLERMTPAERNTALVKAWTGIQELRTKAEQEAAAQPPKAAAATKKSKAKEAVQTGPTAEEIAAQKEAERKARVAAYMEEQRKAAEAQPAEAKIVEAKPVTEEVTQAEEVATGTERKFPGERVTRKDAENLSPTGGRILKGTDEESLRKEAEARVAMEDRDAAISKQNAEADAKAAAAEAAPIDEKPEVNNKISTVERVRRVSNKRTADNIVSQPEHNTTSREDKFEAGGESGRVARTAIHERAKRMVAAAGKLMSPDESGKVVPSKLYMSADEDLAPNEAVMILHEAQRLAAKENPTLQDIRDFRANEFLLRNGMRDEYLKGRKVEGDVKSKAQPTAANKDGETVNAVDTAAAPGLNPEEHLAEAQTAGDAATLASDKPDETQERPKVTSESNPGYSVGAKKEGAVKTEVKKKRIIPKGIAGKAKEASAKITKGEAIKELEADRRVEKENIEGLKKTERNTLNSDGWTLVEGEETSGVEVPTDAKDKSFVAALRRMLKSITEPGTGARYLAGVSVDFGSFQEMAARLDADMYFDAVVNRRFVRTFGASFLRQENIQKLLFDRINKVAGNVPVYVIPDRVMNRIKGEGTSAFYSPLEDHIVMRESIFKKPDGFIHDLMHEGAHAALWHAVRSSPEIRRQLSTILAEYRKQWIEYGNEPDRVRNAYAKYDEASAKLEEMYQKMGTPEWSNAEHDAVEAQKVEAYNELVEAVNEARQGSKERRNMTAGERPYVFYNIDEFLSELISNPDVMKDLSGFTVPAEAFEKVGVPAPKGKLGTVMEFIKGLVAKALELPSLFKGPNAYEQSLELVEKLLMRAQRDRREFYSRDTDGKSEWVQERQNEYNDFASKNWAYHNDYGDRIRRGYEENTWFDAQAVANKKPASPKQKKAEGEHFNNLLKTGLTPSNARPVAKLIAANFPDGISEQDFAEIAQAYLDEQAATKPNKPKNYWNALIAGGIPRAKAIEINNILKEEIGKSIDPATVDVLVQDMIDEFGKKDTSESNSGGIIPPYTPPDMPGMGPGDAPQRMAPAFKGSYEGIIPLKLRRFFLKAMTLDFVRQKYSQYFQTEKGNPLKKWVEAIQSRESIADDFALPIEKLGSEFQNLDPKEQVEFVSLALEATTLDVKLGGVPNTHLGVNAAKGLQAKNKVDALNARFEKLSPEAQDLYFRLTKQFREAHNDTTKGLVYNILSELRSQQEEAQAAGGPPPTITTGNAMDLMDRIVNGNLTDADEQLINNKTVFNALKRAASLRLIKGDYFPLHRFGEYVVTTRDAVKNPGWTSISAKAGKKKSRTVAVKTEVIDSKYTPDGEGAVPDTVRVTFNPDERGNRIAVMRHLREFAASHDLTLVSISTKYRDRQTGKIVSRGDQIVDREYDMVYDARFQNEGVHFFDSEAEAREFHDISDSHFTSQVMDREKVNVREHLSGGQLGAIVGMIEAGAKAGDKRTDTGPGMAHRKQMINLLENALISQMAGNRAQKHFLKRRNVRGASRDMLRGIFTYARAMGNHYATLNTAPAMRNAVREMQDIAKRRQTNRTGLMSEFMNEVYRREDAIVNPRKQMNITRDISTLSYFDKLISVAFSMINGLQTVGTTLPVLAGRHGGVRAVRALGDAYNKMGFADTLLQGITNTGKAVKDIRKMALDTSDLIGSARQKLGKEYEALIDEMVRLGIVSSDSGLEIGGVIEQGRGKWGRGLHKVDRAARQLPNAIEAVNRIASAVAAYDLAIEDGMSKQDAIERARTTASNTQGDYRGSNTPNWMKVPFLGWALQFKKYALMQACLMGDMVHRATSDASHAERVVARKQLMYYFGTQGVMAGAFGLPIGTEIAKTGFILAGMFLGGDGWDEEEYKLRKAVEGAFGETMGSVINNGLLSTVTGIDFASKLSLSDLIVGREPKAYDDPNIDSYWISMIGGAPGSLVQDWYNGVRELYNARTTDDRIKAVSKLVPVKTFSDMAAAYRNYENGEVGVGGAIANAAGFRTLKQSEEARDGAHERRMKQKAAAEVKSLIGDFYSALDRNDAKDKAMLLRKIHEHNRIARREKRRGDIINPGALRRSWLRKKREKANAP